MKNEKDLPIIDYWEGERSIPQIIASWIVMIVAFSLIGLILYGPLEFWIGAWIGPK